MWQYKQKKNYRIEPGNIAVYVRVARQAVFRPHKAVFINFAQEIFPWGWSSGGAEPGQRGAAAPLKIGPAPVPPPNFRACICDVML